MKGFAKLLIMVVLIGAFCYWAFQTVYDEGDLLVYDKIPGTKEMVLVLENENRGKSTWKVPLTLFYQVEKGQTYTFRFHKSRFLETDWKIRGVILPEE